MREPFVNECPISLLIKCAHLSYDLRKTKVHHSQLNAAFIRTQNDPPHTIFNFQETPAQKTHDCVHSY
jgi:hypothetical protein